MAETFRLRHGTSPLAHPSHTHTHAKVHQLGNSTRSSLTESGGIRLCSAHVWKLERHIFRTCGRPHPQTTNVEPTISAWTPKRPSRPATISAPRCHCCRFSNIMSPHEHPYFQLETKRKCSTFMSIEQQSCNSPNMYRITWRAPLGVSTAVWHV